MKKSSRKRNRKKLKGITSLSPEMTQAILKGEKKSQFLEKNYPDKVAPLQTLIPDFGAYYREKIDENKPCLFMVFSEEIDENIPQGGGYWQRNKDDKFGSLSITVERQSFEKESEEEPLISSQEKYLATIEFEAAIIPAFEKAFFQVLNNQNKVMIFVATPNFQASYKTQIGDQVWPFLGSLVSLMEATTPEEEILALINHEVPDLTCIIKVSFS